MSEPQRRAQIERRRFDKARHKYLRLLSLRSTNNQESHHLDCKHLNSWPNGKFTNAFACQDFQVASRLATEETDISLSESAKTTTHAKASRIVKNQESSRRQHDLAKSNLIDVLRTSDECPIPSEQRVSWWRQRHRPIGASFAKTFLGRRGRNVKFIRWHGRRRSHRQPVHGGSSKACAELQILDCRELKLDVNCDSRRHVSADQVPTLADRSATRTNCLTNSHYSRNRAPPHWAARKRRPSWLTMFVMQMLVAMALLSTRGEATLTHSDPRPTIYSGQVSFGLLLSAHSSPGSDMTTAASDSQLTTLATKTLSDQTTLAATEPMDSGFVAKTTTKLPFDSPMILANQSLDSDLRPEASETDEEAEEEAEESLTPHPRRARARNHERRQIFERQSQHQVRRQQQQQQQQQQQMQKIAAAKQQHAALDASCGQVNPNALYAGMGAIWASHQANLVGDSQLAIGTYVYDSCNDLDVGQRQSVRIVSNLNAFQQTTCESPRGSPISLTIAHGDNQLRAIQLLTSFHVPVITTREHFALEDYHLLSQEQRNFLFSTAPSSRHLALGALKFSKRVVSRSTESPKLPNQFHKMSPKNGLIVISRNLPAKFIAYLTDNIPVLVNYEMLHSSQPIDQIRSVEALESILINKNGAANSGSSASSSSSESRISETRVSASTRSKRMTSDDSSDGSSSSSDSDPGEEQQQQQPRMLSPTILMFITPSEAIDLVTRLRNDLAEVSRYYSLIVATREDISPALRTIFQRGGSRLCSGKAFYTISPKPDEVNEFSRYFRDTVQMDGESSDHPLICEYAKHVSSSKTNVDLDDVSTESVIKAVWSAAAAFKMVHKRECQPSATGNIYMANSNSDADELGHQPNTRSSKHGRQSASNSANNPGKSAHSECLIKMNKNMSNLVQKALKRLDVHINSTGLQALDGFRIKFDQSNELLTNKFSIKYINKECEITEIGEYSGLDKSKLNLHESTLIKSLESTLPDSWPVTSPPATPSASTRTAGVSGSSTNSEAPSTASSADSASTNSDDSNSADSASSPGESGTSNGAEDATTKSKGDDDSEPTGSNVDNDKMPVITLESDSPKKKRSNAKPIKQDQTSAVQPKQQFAMSSGQAGGLMPLVSDFYSTASSGKQTTNGPSLPSRTTKAPQEETTPTPTMRKIKPFPNNGVGSTLKEWLPRDETTTMSSSQIVTTTRVPRLLETNTTRAHSNESLATSSTTQAPQYSALPESGGNTDLDMPAFKSVTTTKAPSSSSSSTNASAKRDSRARSLDTAATSDASDYVTLPSIVRHNTRELDNLQLDRAMIQNASNQQLSSSSDFMSDHRSPKLNYLADLTTSPVPLSSMKSPLLQINHDNSIRLADLNQSTSSEQRSSSRSRFRSQLKWIYSSWFTMTILGANICGALLTLYVLTFLLIKNCDGSLDRENQGIRSMHLLAIIVVFFGSTLFIVYPTPGLCLLRTSWHNFALVLIFGSLLLQTMQFRSISSLGLGGRPNRLNQFLTLLFMVGVQVSFELQRWKYESANYVNFVNQYFSSADSGDKKLISMTNSMVGSFNPLNSFNDQATPVSIQVSEKYQTLLHDYCSQPIEDFLQSQIYLWIIIGLLIVFSIAARRKAAGNSALMKGKLKSKSSASNSLSAPLSPSTKKPTSGRLLASQHEANLLTDSAMEQSFDPFTSNVIANGKLAQRYRTAGNVFSVTLISTPIYLASVILHVHGQNFVNDDLISSVTMVLIAFTILIGTFLPVLRNVSRYGNIHMNSSDADQLTRASLSKSGAAHQVTPTNPANDSSQQRCHNKSNGLSSGSPGAFAMFPEFASTGLRRPSSISGESGSHGASGGSRRPFAETKESRRQMGVSLANLPAPPADSLRSLCVYSHHQENHNRMSRMSEGAPYGHSASGVGQLDAGLLNLKLNLATVNDELNPQPILDSDYHQQSANSSRHHNRGHHKQLQSHKVAPSRRSSSSGEKRLIMLDVDPCCPRHGVGATEGWSHRHSAGGASCLDDGFASGSHLGGPS